MSKVMLALSEGTRFGESIVLRNAPEDLYKRSREPVTRSGTRVRGCFPSIKNGRAVHWESQLEQSACYRFEFSPLVVCYREQPAPIYVATNQEKLSKCTADFELELASGDVCYVEVKPFEKLQNLEVRSRLVEVSEYYRQKGFYFIVLTDLELSNRTLTSNLSLLRQHLSVLLCNDVVDVAQRVVSTTTACSIKQLAQSIGSLTQVYALLAHAYLTTDLNQPLCSDSILEFNKESGNEKFIFSGRVAPDFELVSL